MNFLYNFDILGPNPKLYIFKSEKYKSLFSLIISLIIIFLSFIFILYSLIIYFKFDKPTISYTKSNDLNEERKIFLKNSIIMFQYLSFDDSKRIDESIAYFQAEYRAIYDNGTTRNIDLKVESCKLGKNLNARYAEYFKEKISKLSNNEYLLADKNIEDFYCISSDDVDLSLFHLPDIGYNSINLFFNLKNQTEYIPETIALMIIYENNLFNHNDKKSPITEGIGYQFIEGFSSYEFTLIKINFQYFNYETDDGLFLDSSKNLYGMSFLDMIYYRGNKLNIQNDFNTKNYSTIGEMSFMLNRSNYDYYRRTYKKLQALIAEIMSIVSLLFEIGTQICGFLNEKKMSIDVIRKLFMTYNKFNIEKKKRYFQADRIKMIPKKINNSLIISESNSSNFKILTNGETKMIYENRHEKVLKSINIFNIIKSFIFNSNKDKLINICHNIIIEDMCIENILEKFYNLVRIYKSILEEERNNLGLNKDPRFREINSIIYSIYNLYK
jgi:hypothetical protein